MDKQVETVDVLAVLRRHAKAERARLGTTDNDTQAALAAMAELIEACRERQYANDQYSATQDPITERKWRDRALAAYERERVALVRIGAAS